MRGSAAWRASSPRRSKRHQRAALEEAPRDARDLGGVRDVAARLLQHRADVDVLEALGPRLTRLLEREMQRREIAEVYGYPSEFHVLASGGLRKGSHYIVRVVKGEPLGSLVTP